VKQHRVQRHPWIDLDLARQLKTYCAARRETETSVFNAALRDYFADAKDSTLVMRRLDRNDRAVAVVRQTVDLLSETVIAFVQSYFTNTPEMPEPQRKLGATTARRRLDELLDAAARRAPREIIAETVNVCVHIRRDPRARARRRLAGLDFVRGLAADGSWDLTPLGSPGELDQFVSR
jgi:hypothetical protein